MHTDMQAHPCRAQNRCASGMNLEKTWAMAAAQSTYITDTFVIPAVVRVRDQKKRRGLLAGPEQDCKKPRCIRKAISAGRGTLLNRLTVAALRKNNIEF